MNDLQLRIAKPPASDTEIVAALRNGISGDVRFDRLSRCIYATDASIYEIVPLGVVLPKNVQDVVHTVNVCREFHVPMIARGAGTGLTGGAVGEGVQIDLSRFMNRIGKLDTNARTVEVEPGVVLDELNSFLAPHGLHFSPDVATSSRATIGGMIANNSCGAHSVWYGRTVDHIAALTVVLANGERVTFRREPAFEASQTNPIHDRADQIDTQLAAIRNQHYEEIQRRFPKVMRSNGGYGLDRLGPPDSRADATRVICGSEGTLGIVVAATLKLSPIPQHRELVVLHFDDLLKALSAVPAILAHRPAAIELVDRLIVEAGRANPALASTCGFLQGTPEALLAVEFFADAPDPLKDSVDALLNDQSVCAPAFARVRLSAAKDQAEAWNLRNAGLGLMMSKPGDEQPYSFVEDTAVDPKRLREYIERFTHIIKRENVSAGYYAHASVGCLHVKPVLNLKRGSDVERMRRIAEAVCDLAVEFGGTMTGEHGDGIVRSCWLERMYGPRIMEAFREVKKLFDPHGIMNPHKIVDPWPMTERLRYGALFRARQQPKTQLDFSLYGGMDGLAGMCSGVGQCRQRLVGVMCPSYIATGDEAHTTRARANALRMALSNHGLVDGLDDPALTEVMDLCISCKACRSECPTGVDTARLKAEWQSHQNLTHGVSRRSRFIAEAPHWAARGGKFPRLANAISQNRFVRHLMEHRHGLDRRIPPPRLATQTFRNWLRKHRRNKQRPQPSRGHVAYFVDTWTNYFTPQVGIAAVTLLEAAGYEVLCPPTVCCGRPAISKGLLTEAKYLAETNVRALAHLVAAEVPIVGTEPSCLLTLVDEYPQLCRTQLARRLADQSFMIESFLKRLLDQQPDALRFQSDSSILYHAHCHQKALVGSQDAVALLRHAFGDHAAEIPSGCCGMAGSFGHETEHYEIAKSMGEHRLFPAVRSRGEAVVAVSGFSCRQQIEHHTGVAPMHLIEHLAAAIAHLSPERKLRTEHH